MYYTYSLLLFIQQILFLSDKVNICEDQIELLNVDLKKINILLLFNLKEGKQTTNKFKPVEICEYINLYSNKKQSLDVRAIYYEQGSSDLEQAQTDLKDVLNVIINYDSGTDSPIDWSTDLNKLYKDFQSDLVIVDNSDQIIEQLSKSLQLLNVPVMGQIATQNDFVKNNIHFDNITTKRMSLLPIFIDQHRLFLAFCQQFKIERFNYLYSADWVDTLDVIREVTSYTDPLDPAVSWLVNNQSSIFKPLDIGDYTFDDDEWIPAAQQELNKTIQMIRQKKDSRLYLVNLNHNWLKQILNLHMNPNDDGIQFLYYDIVQSHNSNNSGDSDIFKQQNNEFLKNSFVIKLDDFFDSSSDTVSVVNSAETTIKVIIDQFNKKTELKEFDKTDECVIMSGVSPQDYSNNKCQFRKFILDDPEHNIFTYLQHNNLKNKLVINKIKYEDQIQYESVWDDLNSFNANILTNYPKIQKLNEDEELISAIDTLESLNVNCQPGTYISAQVEESNTIQQCIECQQGTYSQQQNTQECIKTSPGQYQPLKGSQFQIKCEKGFYQANEATTACNNCPQGFQQDSKGSIKCKVCDKNKTTVIIGATSENFCVCKFNYFLTDEGCVQLNSQSNSNADALIQYMYTQTGVTNTSDFELLISEGTLRLSNGYQPFCNQMCSENPTMCCDLRINKCKSLGCVGSGMRNSTGQNAGMYTVKLSYEQLRVDVTRELELRCDKLQNGENCGNCETSNKQQNQCLNPRLEPVFQYLYNILLTNGLNFLMCSTYLEKCNSNSASVNCDLVNECISSQQRRYSWYLDILLNIVLIQLCMKQFRFTDDPILSQNNKIITKYNYQYCYLKYVVNNYSIAFIALQQLENLSSESSDTLYSSYAITLISDFITLRWNVIIFSNMMGLQDHQQDLQINSIIQNSQLTIFSLIVIITQLTEEFLFYSNIITTKDGRVEGEQYGPQSRNIIFNQELFFHIFQVPILFSNLMIFNCYDSGPSNLQNAISIRYSWEQSHLRCEYTGIYQVYVIISLVNTFVICVTLFFNSWNILWIEQDVEKIRIRQLHEKNTLLNKETQDFNTQRINHNDINRESTISMQNIHKVSMNNLSTDTLRGVDEATNQLNNHIHLISDKLFILNIYFNDLNKKGSSSGQQFGLIIKLQMQRECHMLMTEYIQMVFQVYLMTQLQLDLLEKELLAVMSFLFLVNQIDQYKPYIDSLCNSHSKQLQFGFLFVTLSLLNLEGEGQLYIFFNYFPYYIVFLIQFSFIQALTLQFKDNQQTDLESSYKRNVVNIMSILNMDYRIETQFFSFCKTDFQVFHNKAASFLEKFKSEISKKVKIKRTISNNDESNDNEYQGKLESDSTYNNKYSIHNNNQYQQLIDNYETSKNTHIKQSKKID